MYLPTGSLFCFVADPRKMTARILVEEHDAQLVDSGQHVEILLDNYPSHLFTTQLDQVSRRNANIVPAELTDLLGGPIPTTAGPDGERNSMFVMHEATAPIHDPPVPLLPGFHGIAKVTLRPAPLVATYGAARSLACDRRAQFARLTPRSHPAGPRTRVTLGESDDR